MTPTVVTQARMTSTRLPGKVLIEVGGKPLLDYHLDRLLAAGLDVVVATTVNSTDDPVAALAERRGLRLIRGSEHDVLSRYAEAVRTFDLDSVVRVTSDCPLIDGAAIAEGIRRFVETDDPDLYVANTLTRTWPRGFDFEIFSAAALLEADESATDAAYREHVTPYLHQNANGRMRLLNLPLDQDRSAYRITLDTSDDLVLIRTLIEKHDAHTLDAAGIIAILDEHPDLAAINAHVEQKKLQD